MGHIAVDLTPIKNEQGGYYYDDGAELGDTDGDYSDAPDNGSKNKKKGHGKKHGDKKKHKKSEKKGGKKNPKSSEHDDAMTPDGHTHSERNRGESKEQRKRMDAVDSYGGWMDYLHAAMGSNHGAAFFGPQGMVAW